MKKVLRPRVLALHGSAATAALYRDVSTTAHELDLVAPDLVALTLAVGGRLGSLLRALAGIVPEGPVLLTGCGVGANIALELAAQLGDRVRGVLLTSPLPLRPDAVYRERTRQFARLLAAEMGVDEVLAWTPIMVHRDGLRGRRAAQQAEAMLRIAATVSCAPLVQLGADFPDGNLALKRLVAPVRALFAAECINPFLGETLIADWTKALGPGAVELIAQTRHWLPIEAPEKIVAELRAFAAAPPRIDAAPKST
ncbi:alpha/beta fold hydrolase [Vulgatibacter sp.]|uniref:alpha/beta fold hydrolase n=1 Tax=Vulgatibacter sp. TaxID=1971226 RepID=UPI003563E9B8